MAASRWIEAATEPDQDEARPTDGLRRIAKKRHAEPDADERGGPSDQNADDKKRKKARFMQDLNTPVGY